MYVRRDQTTTRIKRNNKIKNKERNLKIISQNVKMSGPTGVAADLSLQVIFFFFFF